MNELNKLKELTENLPEIPTLSELIHNPGNYRNYVEYKVDSGTCIGFGLLNQKEVSVQKLFLSKGTTFPSYAHNKEKEIWVLYEGELSVTNNNKTRILIVGDIVGFNPGDLHEITAIKDTWLITTAIPSMDGYPK